MIRERGARDRNQHHGCQYLHLSLLTLPRQLKPMLSSFQGQEIK
jgi:hypothetical protein